ncbi:MAG: phosphotransferase family protein [Pseudomonadota bacterium]
MSLDLAAVAAWMTSHIRGFEGPVTAQKFATGQSNPTYKLLAQSGSYVLRRKPSGVLLPKAHAVEREFRVQMALSGSDVPVPAMLALCEDGAVIGSAFYVMEYVAGESFDDPRLPGLAPERRGAIFTEMARVLATIHSVDLGITGLQDFGPKGAYFARQIGRWTKQYRSAETEELPQMEGLIEALTRAGPVDDGRVCLVHGDFRLDNLLFDRGGAVCRAVLDWELSTLGHPLADLAAVVMQWQMPPGGVGRGLAGTDRAALGVPSDAEFIAEYCGRMGVPVPDDFGPYLAFAFFRMAAVLQGVKRRGLDGNASNPERAAELGALVPEFARQGLAALARSRGG